MKLARGEMRWSPEIMAALQSVARRPNNLAVGNAGAISWT